MTRHHITAYRITVLVLSLLLLGAPVSPYVQTLAELKSQFASKEQSVRYMEKSLKREAREKKGLEQKLKSAEHTVDVLTRSDSLATDCWPC